MLRIGVHHDVEVTDADGFQLPIVSQAFCSALPVAYSRVPRVYWQAFASLVLESAYEATLCAAADNMQRGGTNVVLLTSLGGGAFGNDDDWIHAAIRRAIRNAAGFDLDVRLVSYGSPSRWMLQFASEFASGHHHGQSLRDQLTSRFEAQATIRTGHERHTLSCIHCGF